MPCGVADRGVTSLVDLGLPVTMPDVDLALKSAFETVFGPAEEASKPALQKGRLTMSRIFDTAISAALLVLVSGVALAQQATDAVAPESASGLNVGQAVEARHHMVVAANPLAAEAGLDVLRGGGNAADALVAVQTVLGLVEPQSSGLGGGAFLVWYDAASGTVTTFDGRETAPAAATPDLFMGPDGKPLGFFEAVVGGRSVGVPGVPRLLETVQAKIRQARLARSARTGGQAGRGRLCRVAAPARADRR